MYVCVCVCMCVWCACQLCTCACSRQAEMLPLLHSLTACCCWHWCNCDAWRGNFCWQWCCCKLLCWCHLLHKSLSAIFVCSTSATDPCEPEEILQEKLVCCCFPAAALALLLHWARDKIWLCNYIFWLRWPILSCFSEDTNAHVLTHTCTHICTHKHLHIHTYAHTVMNISVSNHAMPTLSLFCFICGLTVACAFF